MLAARSARASRYPARITSPWRPRHARCMVNHDFYLSPRHRSLFTETITSISTPLLPPLAFTGFFLALWVYKCVTLVVLQNKIIYMPGLPPGARSKTIQDYCRQSDSIVWEEEHIRSLDWTDLALVVSRNAHRAALAGRGTSSESVPIVIIYFQGNGASIPPRLPQLSRTLEGIRATSPAGVSSTIIALSYRGYWKSRGRPSQRGIEQDAIATLRHVQTAYPNSRVILWGQSIGAGVATTLLASHLRRVEQSHTRHGVAGLILETPFVPLKAMLVALYPQKWLPYRYLHPFLRSHWDSEVALKSISTTMTGRSIPVLFLEAGKDELVPPGQGKELVELCEARGMDVRSSVVPGALHVEATSKAEGRRAIVDFISSIAREEQVQA